MAQQLASMKWTRFQQLAMVWSVLMLAPTLLEIKNPMLSTSNAGAPGERDYQNLRNMSRVPDNLVHLGAQLY